MDGLHPDNTDASSIKPVSSLLSHFEQLNITPNSNSLRSRSQSPDPRAHQSRPTKPVSPVQTGTRQPSHSYLQNDATDFPPVVDVRHQRPSSTGPDLASQFSPVVTIKPPKSPPKSNSLSLSTPSWRDSLSVQTPNSVSTLGVSSPRHFRIPSRPHTPLVEQRKQPLLSPSSASQPPEPPPPRISAELRRDAPSKPLPRPTRPVSRSEKPKIPAKRNFDFVPDREFISATPETQFTSYREPPLRLPISRETSPTHSMLAPAIPSRPPVKDTATGVKSTGEPLTSPSVNLSTAKWRDFEPKNNTIGSQSVVVSSLDEQKPILPARPEVQPSKPLISRPKSVMTPYNGADGSQDVKKYAPNPRHFENKFPSSRNPDSATSPSRLHPPVIPRTPVRSMSTDQTGIKTPADSQHFSRVPYDSQETSISRSSHVAPPSITMDIIPNSLEYPDPSRSNRRPDRKSVV